jgi:hypothetical protein
MNPSKDWKAKLKRDRFFQVQSGKMTVCTYGMALLTSSARLRTVFACELVTLHKHS